MAITRLDPNRIFLGGTKVDINDLACSEAITPGMLLERAVNGTVVRLRKHATAAGGGPALFAEGHFMANKSVTDDYAIGDLVEAFVAQPGAEVWGFIASGQNIATGNKLESAGNGTLRIFGSGVIIATALEGQANVTVQTRIRVETV